MGAYWKVARLTVRYFPICGAADGFQVQEKKVDASVLEVCESAFEGKEPIIVDVMRGMSVRVHLRGKHLSELM